MSVFFVLVLNMMYGVMCLRIIPYNRDLAAAYARRWALGRNPAYFDFHGIGGDCTNFVSQCIYAGTGIMNYTPEFGWFYRSPNHRTPPWTGVEYLYRFLTENQSVGPYGSVCELSQVQRGDVIQLGDREGDYYHSLFVLHGYPNIRVAAHSGDALNRSLTSYVYDTVRCIHLLGARTWS